LTPKLRFPEFRDASGWEYKSLGRVAKLKNGYAFKSSDYTDTGQYGIVTISNVQEGWLSLKAIKRISELPLDIQDHQKLFLDDILISMTGNVGRTCRVTESNLLLNQRVGKLIPGDVNRDFFYQALQAETFRKRMQLGAAGGAQGNLSSSTISSYPFSCPGKKNEQQKIADCLGSMDDCIAAAGRKLAALRDHKRGLLQQLFPQPGQAQPELRFPEFRNNLGWTKKKAGELFSQRKAKGQTGLPLYSVTIDDGMVLRSSFDRNFYDIEDAAKNKKVFKNDIAYNMMRMWQGACGVAPKDCMVSPAYVVLKPKKGIHSEFFFTWFKLYGSLQLLTEYSRGLTKDRLRLYFEDFASVPMIVPEEKEQKKIAACLTALDAQINAQATKLDTLQKHKRGLMQQLFPSPE